MAEPSFFMVKSEDDAWQLLEMALRKDSRLQGAQLNFSNWPKLEIVLKGRDLEGTLPSRYLPALQEYQESVFKLYSLFRYREYSVRRLKDAEKQELELVFKVEKGSSEFLAPFAEALQKIGLEAAARMNPQQLTIFLCLVALLVGSGVGWARWLKYKEDKNAKDSSNKAVDAIAKLAQEYAARDAMLIKAIANSRVGKIAMESVDEANTRLALSMDPDDKLVVGGQKLEGSDLRKLATAPRQNSDRFSEEGPAFLSSVENNFKGVVVGVRMPSKDYTFFAKVDSTRLAQEEVNCISQAIFKKKPIWIHVEGKVRHGKVTEALVYSVRDLTQKERKLLKEEGDD